MYKNLSLLFILGLLLTGCGTKKNDVECLIKTDDICITKISKSYAVDGNYWDGAKEACGGIKNMPKAADLTKIAAYVYEGNPRFPADETKSGLQPKDTFKIFDIDKSGYFIIFSEEMEQAKKYSYVRTYYQKQTDWKSIDSSAGGNVLTVCIKH